MIEALIKIRFKQLSRGISELGLIRTIFVFGLLAFVAWMLLMQTSGSPNTYYASGAYLIIIALTQIRRQDKVFLKSHFANYTLILLAEYTLLTTPLIICLIFYGHWIPLGCVFLAIVFILNLDIKPKERTLNTKIQQLIPPESFEWKAGIRKTFFLIAVLWVLGLSTSFFIGSVPIIIFILGILQLSFYDNAEPLQMILACEKSPRKFISQKIKLQTLLFSILIIPLIASFLIFHYDRWYIPVTEYFLFVLLHIYIILTKYAFYEPNKKSDASQVFGSLGTIGTILPIFAPVVWLMSIRFYYKSRENLNFYLDDFN